MADSIAISISGLSARRFLLLRSLIRTVAPQLAPSWHVCGEHETAQVTLYDPAGAKHSHAAAGLRIKVVDREELNAEDSDPSLAYPPTLPELRQFLQDTATRISPRATGQSELLTQPLNQSYFDSLIASIAELSRAADGALAIRSAGHSFALIREQQSWRLTSASPFINHVALQQDVFWSQAERVACPANADQWPAAGDPATFIWQFARHAARHHATAALTNKLIRLKQWPLIPSSVLSSVTGMRLCVALAKTEHTTDQLSALNIAPREDVMTLLLAGHMLGFLTRRSLPADVVQTTTQKPAHNDTHNSFFASLRSAFGFRRRA